MEMIRTFISIPVPRSTVLNAVLSDLKKIPGVSVSREIHLTLQFIGDVEEDKIRTLSEKIQKLHEHPSFVIDLKGIGAFPGTKRPRVVWIGAYPAEPMRAMVEDIRSILDSLRIEYDNRSFKAHVTIGRVKDPSQQLTEFLMSNENREIDSFTCNEVDLMKSILTQQGAVHSIIAAVCLK